MDYIERKRKLEVKEFFSSSFGNQELYYAELDSISSDLFFDQKLRTVVQCLSRLVHPEKVILHLEETQLSTKRLRSIIDGIKMNEENIRKLAIVGVHGIDVLRLRWQFKKAKFRKHLRCKIVDDLQYAKEWMVAIGY